MKFEESMKLVFFSLFLLIAGVYLKINTTTGYFTAAAAPPNNTASATTMIPQIPQLAYPLIALIALGICFTAVYAHATKAKH